MVAVPEISVNAGWDAVGTPVVEIWRIQLLATPANDWMPPSVLADGLGRSAPTKDRNVGVAAAPVVGPAHTRLADCVASVPVRVPVLMTGLPDTVNMPGRASPTLVTVPVPEMLVHVVLPDPSVLRTWLFVPLVIGRLNIVAVPAAALAPIVTEPDVAPFRIIAPPVPPFAPKVGCEVCAQTEAPRLSTVPAVVPNARSIKAVCVAQLGSPVEAVGLPQTSPEAGWPLH